MFYLFSVKATCFIYFLIFKGNKYIYPRGFSGREWSDRDSLEKTYPTEIERTRLVNQGSCGLIPGCTSLLDETLSHGSVSI